MGIIQELKTEGVLKLYHDYRAGHTKDLSGNGNDVSAYTGVSVFNKDGLDFDTPSDIVTILDSEELRLTTGTIVVYMKHSKQESAGPTYLTKISGATGYGLRVWSGAALAFTDGTVNSTIATDVTSANCVSVNFADTEKPEFFVDGVSVGEGSLASDINSGTQNISIPGSSTHLLNTYGAVMILSRKLTATEHAQLFAELEATHYPTKPQTKSQASLKVDPSESGLVGGWNMRPENNTVIDQSSSSSDGTLNGSPSHGKDILGDYIHLASGDYIALANDGSLAPQSQTISGWVKLDNPASATAQVIYSIIGDNLKFNVASSALQAVWINDSAGSKDLSGGTVLADKWHHVCFTVDDQGASMTGTIYLDGASVDSGTLTGDWAKIGSASDPHIGKRSSSFTQYLIGQIASAKLYNEAKDADWVAQEYAKGRPALWKTDWGATESPANVTSGELENTGWTVGSGTWKVSTDTINGQLVKVFDCVSSGILYIPTEQFGQTLTEAAYGTWEFWVNKATASVFNIMPITDSKLAWDDASTNGYLMQSIADESLNMYEITGGSSAGKLRSSAGAIGVATWAKLKITRSNAGVSTFYIDDVLVDADVGGANPFTDTTVTTSKYITIDVDIGDKVAISNTVGNKSLTKSLTVN